MSGELLTDMTTETGCTVRLRMPGFDPTKMLLIYDMGPDDGRYAEVMLTLDEARILARALTALADRMDI